MINTPIALQVASAWATYLWFLDSTWSRCYRNIPQMLQLIQLKKSRSIKFLHIFLKFLHIFQFSSTLLLAVVLLFQLVFFTLTSVQQ